MRPGKLYPRLSVVALILAAAMMATLSCRSAASVDAAVVVGDACTAEYSAVDFTVTGANRQGDTTVHSVIEGRIDGDSMHQINRYKDQPPGTRRYGSTAGCTYGRRGRVRNGGRGKILMSSPDRPAPLHARTKTQQLNPSTRPHRHSAGAGTRPTSSSWGRPPSAMTTSRSGTTKHRRTMPQLECCPGPSRTGSSGSIRRGGWFRPGRNISRRRPKVIRCNIWTSPSPSPATESPTSSPPPSYRRSKRH